jgi:hypothetical protein
MYKADANKNISAAFNPEKTIAKKKKLKPKSVLQALNN